ncbi:MAG: Ig-like domain-containing protein, partial [Opitutaceae bacterium]|nr:Ig-like domain-containing protein [Opitutaceae bacterium]
MIPHIRHKLTRALSAALVSSILSLVSLGAVPAFPGAEGFGAAATGGRGGEVYIVTNLNDSGPGSLRDAVSQPNRIVVFVVGGVIRVTSRIVVKNNITIAGQTAPGSGITVYGNGVSFSGASNSITRYIRFRMGINGDSGKDCIALANGHDMIFDHVSASWGRDETFSISPDSGATAERFTIQDCIIAQGLQTHSCGGLIQTDGGVSIFRSLYIDNKTRNPKVKGVNDFTNNIIYNWGGGGAYIMGDSAGRSDVNVVNNYFVGGPDTGAAPFTRGNENFHIYASGNYKDLNKNGVLDGTEIPHSEYQGIPSGIFQSTRYGYPPVTTLLTPAQAFQHVLDNAGASLVRDAVDAKFIAEAASLGTLGEQPSREDDSLLDFATVVYSTRVDTDQDGMPDDWEIAMGLDPADPADANGDYNGDGYTNIEKYINSLAPGGVQQVTITGLAPASDSGLSSTDGITNAASLTLRGTAPAGASVTITLGAATVATAVTADADGAWSAVYTPGTLSEGLYPFVATLADDPAATPSPAYFVRIDRSAPAVPEITSVVMGTVDVPPEGTITVHGTAEPGSSVSVASDAFSGGSVVFASADADGFWTALAIRNPGVTGDLSFTAQSSDTAGNTGPASDPYVIDTAITAPAITGLAPATDTGVSDSDNITSNPAFVLRGTAADGMTVSITRVGAGIAGTAIPSGGVWTLDCASLALGNGVHTFSAVATNAAGKSSAASTPLPVTLDTVVPAIASIVRHTPAAIAIIADTVVFRATFTEPVAGVDAADFTVTATGATQGTVASVQPVSDSVYDITVNGITGEGTLRLDLKSAGTVITDHAGNAAAGFTSGQTYTVRLAGSGVWVAPDEGGLWSDIEKWEGGVAAGGDGATADLGAIDIEADIDISLDAPRALGNLIFGDTDTATAAGWRIDGGAAPHTLALSTATGTSSITVNALGSGKRAVIAAPLAVAGALSKSGAGTLVLSGSTTIGGVLRVSTNSGTLAVGAGGFVDMGAQPVRLENTSRLLIDGGELRTAGTLNWGTSNGHAPHINVNGGMLRADLLTSPCDRSQAFIVNGGTAIIGRIVLPRNLSNNNANPDYSLGVIVKKGVLHAGDVSIATGNSTANMSVEGGEVMVTGAFVVGNLSASPARGGVLRVSGGRLTATDTVHGLVLNKKNGSNPGTISRFEITGGVTILEKITLGYDDTVTANTATVILNGGALYLGSGGIVKNGASGMTATVTLTKGALGAKADWGSALPMTLTNSSGDITLRAADEAGDPHDITLAGVLSGSGTMTKTGGGTLSLSAANTATSPINVLAGTLLVNGSLASSNNAVTVASGAYIGGSGIINRPVTLQNDAGLALDAGAPLAFLGILTKNAGAKVPLTVAGVSGPGTFTLATFGSTNLTDTDFDDPVTGPGWAGTVTVSGNSLVLTATPDTTALTATIAAAQAILDAASVGNGHGQYPQPARDRLADVIAEATVVASQGSPTIGALAGAIAALQTALDGFADEQIDVEFGALDDALDDADDLLASA